MISATISPESRREFLRDVDAFRRATGKSVEDVIDLVAISAGRSLMQKTLPAGLKATGRAPSGEAFQSSIMAQVYRALKKNIPELHAGESVESIHRRARGSRGTVEKSPRDKENARIPLPSDAVRSAAISHVRKMQHRAGLAKAAWLTAAMEIGSLRRGTIPKYVKRHIGRARGSATRAGAGIRGYSVTLHNEVAHMSQRLLPTRMLAAALKQAYGVVAFELDKVLNGGMPSSAYLRKNRMRFGR